MAGPLAEETGLLQSAQDTCKGGGSPIQGMGHLQKGRVPCEGNRTHAEEQGPLLRAQNICRGLKTLAEGQEQPLRIRVSYCRHGTPSEITGYLQKVRAAS